VEKHSGYTNKEKNRKQTHANTSSSTHHPARFGITSHNTHTHTIASCFTSLTHYQSPLLPFPPALLSHTVLSFRSPQKTLTDLEFDRLDKRAASLPGSDASDAVAWKDRQKSVRSAFEKVGLVVLKPSRAHQREWISSLLGVDLLAPCPEPLPISFLLWQAFAPLRPENATFLSVRETGENDRPDFTVCCNYPSARPELLPLIED
jgi:hypothetical protein